jgi:hypothetical protein
METIAGLRFDLSLPMRQPIPEDLIRRPQAKFFDAPEKACSVDLFTMIMSS